MDIKSFHLRWMLKEDFSKIKEIEEQSFSNPYTLKKLKSLCHNNYNLCHTLLADDKIVGYSIMAYPYNVPEVKILRLAVDENYRRLGCGTEILNSLKSRLFNTGKKSSLSVVIDEYNLAGQLYLKANKFLVVDILKNSDDFDDNVDYYLFSYDIGSYQQECSKLRIGAVS